MFASIPVVPGILTWRGEALSITVAGLIFLMRRYRNTNRIGDPTIEDLVTGESMASVHLGTTRVPDFGSLVFSSAAAAGGYRELEALREAESRIAVGDTFPMAELSLSSEIIASIPTLNIAATEFFHVWHPLFVRASSLFIFIATIHDIPFEPPALDVWQLPTTQEYNYSFPDDAPSRLSSWSASDFSDAILPSQHFDPVYQAVFRGPGSDLHSFTSQPSMADPSETIPAEQTQICEQTQPAAGKGKKIRAPKQARVRSPSASKNNQLVENIMQGHVEYVAFKQAQFIDKSPLAAMVRQYQAMCHCLGLLGLIGTKAEMSNIKRINVNTPADDVSPPIFLSAEMVLIACNWVPQTFVNKTAIYPPAKAATRLEWKGLVPGL